MPPLRGCESDGLMWDGHSCPSLLILVLTDGLGIGFGDFKTKSKINIKIKGDGQECPSHIVRPT